MSKPISVDKKLLAHEASDVKYRDITVFVLLNIITLGIYWFYVVYQWAKEINGLQGRVKYQPPVVLVVSILTCGLAGLVFECLMAFDVAEASASRGVQRPFEQLGMWVIILNCVAIAVSLIPFMFIVAIPLGIIASTLVQMELNTLAEHYVQPETE